MSVRLSHEAFLAQLHTKFQLQATEAASIEVELTNISPLLRTAKQEVFSITMRGPGSFVLEQRTFQFEHKEMGAFDLFLVPIAQDSQGVYYEAVFNRLVSSTGSKQIENI